MSVSEQGPLSPVSEVCNILQPKAIGRACVFWVSIGTTCEQLANTSHEYQLDNQTLKLVRGKKQRFLPLRQNQN